MKLEKHIRRLHERDDVLHAVTVIVENEDFPLGGHSVRGYEDLAGINKTDLIRLIRDLRQRADSLEEELKLL